MKTKNYITFENVLKMLDVKKLPFLDTPQLKGFAIQGATDLLKHHKPKWLKQNRKRLIKELKYIADM